jgi:hypothetical protein
LPEYILANGVPAATVEVSRFRGAQHLSNEEMKRTVG